MTTILAALPLTIVMVAGPQIVSAIFLATSERPRPTSVPYLAGAAVATTTAVILFHSLARALGLEGGSREDASARPIDYVMLGLLVVLMIRVYLARHEAEPPTWMAKLTTATPRFSFALGFLLFLLMPTDVITTFTVGSYLAREDRSWADAIPFIVLTVVLVAIPFIVLLVMGERADVVLPRMRAWMVSHSWVVNELVLAFFAVLLVSGM
jgi:hypothetical protein